MSSSSSNPIEIKAKPADERRIIGPDQPRDSVVASARVIKSASRLNQIPSELLNDPLINNKISASLPTNYNFEIHKTIWRIRTTGARRVALQFPEGLFIFATAISDILTTFTDCDVIILGKSSWGSFRWMHFMNAYHSLAKCVRSEQSLDHFDEYVIFGADYTFNVDTIHAHVGAKKLLSLYFIRHVSSVKVPSSSRDHSLKRLVTIRCSRFGIGEVPVEF